MSPVVSDEMRVHQTCMHRHTLIIYGDTLTAMYFVFTTCTILVVNKLCLFKTPLKILGLSFFPWLFLNAVNSNVSWHEEKQSGRQDR